MNQELPNGVELRAAMPLLHELVNIIQNAEFGNMRKADECYRVILADREKQAARVPEGYALVPMDVLKAASESLGNFVMDHGWGDADMQAMDNLDAFIASAAPTEPSKPVAPPEREAPSIGQIIEVAESWQRGFMCPLCGHDQPHEHSPREITIYRNGVKWGLKNGTEQWPWKGYPSPSKNAGHDSKGVGRQGGHGTDQHHEHRVGQSGSDREVNELDSQGDGVHGAPCVSTQPEPYGQVTTHRVTGQQFFYRWPEPPYLDNASACVTVYAATPAPAQPAPEPSKPEQAEGLGESWAERNLRDMQASADNLRAAGQPELAESLERGIANIKNGSHAVRATTPPASAAPSEQSEPYAWFWTHGGEQGVLTRREDYEKHRRDYPGMEFLPVFTRTNRTPLPADVIVTLYDERPTGDADMIEFAREVEHAHGIKDFAASVHECKDLKHEQLLAQMIELVCPGLDSGDIAADAQDAMRLLNDLAHTPPTSAAPSKPEQAEAASDTLRIACITLDGSTLYIPAKCITDFGIGEDDGETYALTFKNMTRAEFDALGEFDGF